MATPRSDIFHPLEMGIYHCYSRCVRQEFLFGKDHRSKKSYEHRRTWIDEWTRDLARWFAIDVIFNTYMDNHFHLVLRNLPHLVEKWNDRDVIRRAIKIFPCKFKKLGVKRNKPTRAQLTKFTGDRKLVKEMRIRLSDISWFMRQLNQKIARRANAEDECTGHFFEKRFGSRAVTDEAGLLICGIYVDLNQIRAQEARTPETSTRTSAYQRLKALLARRRRSPKAAKFDGYLCPINTQGDQQRAGYSKAGVFGSARASDQGVLEMTVEQYLELLDWSGRQARRGKRGKIDPNTPPILERIGLNGDNLMTFVEHYDELFRVAVGGAESLAKMAEKLGRKWLVGRKAVAALQNPETT